MAWQVYAAMAAGSAVDYLTNSSNIKNEQAWAEYNANMQAASDQMNLVTSGMMTQANIEMSIATSQINAQMIIDSAEYNASMVAITTSYNDQLFEDALTTTWNKAGLDLKLLEQQRAHERGGMRATQGASGTVIGQDSNASMEISSMTQEAMDGFVIKHNASEQAREISNSRALSLWEGENAINKIMWEAETQASSLILDTKLQAAGANFELGISNLSGTLTSESRYYSSTGGSQISAASANSTNTSNLFGGLTSAYAQSFK